MTALSLSFRAQEDVVKTAFIVGGAAFITGNVPPITAFIVGGVYSLISQVTKPFFQNAKLLAFLCNTALTTAAINQFAGVSLSVGKVVYITYLPFVVVAKILVIGLIISAALNTL